MKKAAIYVRQSLDKKNSISIETQIDSCKEELAKGQDFKVYQDKGYSGKNIKRPAFSSLLEDIERGLIEKLIVYKVDRISRSVCDFSNIIKFLEAKEVSFVSASESFDTTDPTGVAMLQMIMVFAELERKTIAERVSGNYYARGKNGVWLGGNAPFGFKIIKSSLNGKTVSVLEPTEDIEIVKEIFNLYSDPNLSLGKISKILYEKYGGTWDNIKLSRILSNPIYVKADADIYRHYKNKKVDITSDLLEFDGTHSAMLYNKQDKEKKIINPLNEQVLSISQSVGVIDSNIFIYVANKKISNRQIKNSGKGTHSFLTGIAKCGYCGYSMRLSTYKDQKYFNCSARTNKTGVCEVKTETHYVKEVEDTVFEFVKAFLNDIGDDATLYEEVAQNNAHTNSLKMQLLKVEADIAKFTDKIREASTTTMKYINAEINKLDAIKMDLEIQINDSFIPAKEMKMPDISDWENADLETKRNITHSLIDKVLIFNDSIEVVWKH